MDEIQLPVIVACVSGAHTWGGLRAVSFVIDMRQPSTAFSQRRKRGWPLALDVVSQDQRGLHGLGTQLERAETVRVVVQSVCFESPVFEQDGEKEHMRAQEEAGVVDDLGHRKRFAKSLSAIHRTQPGVERTSMAFAWPYCLVYIKASRIVR